MIVVAAGCLDAPDIEQQRRRMMNGVGIGKDGVQQRGLRRDLREHVADALCDSLDVGAGKRRKIEDLRDARDVDALGSTLAADERQVEESQYTPSLAPAARSVRGIRSSVCPGAAITI